MSTNSYNPHQVTSDATFTTNSFDERAEFFTFFDPSNPLFSDNLTPSIIDIILDEENLQKEVASFSKNDLSTLQNIATSPVKEINVREDKPLIKRRRIFGEKEVVKPDGNIAFSRIMYTNDPSFRESVRTKGDFISFYLEHIPEEERPSLREFLKMKKFEQKGDMNPSPMEIVKIAIEIWQGNKVMLTDSAINYILRPKHTYTTEERIYCPFCLSTRKLGISLGNHFSECHRIISKKCKCGAIIHKKDKKKHSLTCTLKQKVLIGEDWFDFIEQSFVDQHKVREINQDC